MSRSPRKKPSAPAAPDDQPKPRLKFTAESEPAGIRSRAGRGRRTLALTAIILGSSLAFIDGTVVGVALPAIQGDLRAGPAQIQWVANGYLLALAALVLVGGAAGDRWGRKRVFIGGTVLFTLASLLCAAVWTVENLVAARVLQGIGAAFLVPTSLALIPVCFDERERGKALGVWAGASALTTAVGPILAGWLVDEVGWRSIFLINGPVAAVAIGLAVFAIPESRDQQAGKPDWLGALLAILALGLLGWGLSGAVEWGVVSLQFWAVMAAAFAAGAAFLFVERRMRAPMLPLEMFQYRAFTGVNALTFALYLGLSGAMYLLPFEWMRVDGMSAAQVGAGLLPFAAVLGMGAPLAGRAADRMGPRPFLILGPLLAGAGLVLMMLPEAGARYWTAWLPGLLVLATGMALAIAPLTAALFASADPDRAGVASGVNNAAARVGGLVAVALLTLVLVLVFTAATGLDLADASARLAVIMGGGGSEGTISDADRSAFRTGFQAAMAVSAAFAFAAAAIAAATIPAGRPEEEA